MPKVLLDFNIFEHRATETVIVEFVPQEGNVATWESRLEELAKSGKRVVFRVNYFDPDGIVWILMRHWLRYTPTKTILIETPPPDIQKVLELLLKGLDRKYHFNFIESLV